MLLNKKDCLRNPFIGGIKPVLISQGTSTNSRVATVLCFEEL